MIEHVKSWKELLFLLQTVPEESLNRPIEVLPPVSNGDNPIQLQSGLFLATLGELEDLITQPTAGNDSHPEQLVLGCDHY